MSNPLHTQRPAARVTRVVFFHDLRRLVTVPSTWTLLALAIALAIISAVAAAYMPQIIEALAGDELSAYATATLGEPTWQAASAQWMKNLQQILGLALILVISANLVAELKSGEILFVITRPVSRTTFLLSKVVTYFALLAAVALTGTFAAWVCSRIFFDTAPFLPYLYGTAVWAATLCVDTAVVLAVASLVPRVAAAAAGGLISYLVLSFAGSWKTGATWSLLGLTPLAHASAADAPHDLHPKWILVTALLLITALIVLAVYSFNRKEIN